MEEQQNFPFILKPLDWFPKLLSLQADILHNCILFLAWPLLSLLSMASESYHRAEKSASATYETAVHQVPSTITYGSVSMVKKLGFGLLGAAQVGMVLVVLVVVAAVAGVGLVQMWVEEPVFVRERLFFDYTEANPEAVFSFGKSSKNIKRHFGVPFGHTYQVSLMLLMPESEFNRDIGVFQLTAEVLSINGNVIAKSSQPCMLRFRSLPVRLMRTFLMGVPLVLGISDETQRMTVKILKHKEGIQRTEAIRVILSPRAGTLSLPQLYEAEILLHSKLPWTKQFIRNWKWTFYVWSSIDMFIMLVFALVFCCRRLLFPMTAPSFGDSSNESIERDSTPERSEEPQKWGGYERDISESLRKWQLRRRKRKAIFPCEEETISSSATSMKITTEETSAVIPEDIGDSESVCSGG
ncbi:hypothetical protein Pint_21409 [Pistacia integerrima]|uniref:Uncharacterized protein n=1 Tax=Pistacia integerrima TaxID=434235 RepID=A0ACC0X822_9ROSI|nr:hypothetical protein Pint_21409 [Pistacia integerrima]